MSESDTQSYFTKSKVSATVIVWALSVSPFPMTIKQLTQRLGLDPGSRTDRDNVAQSVDRLYKAGILIRREVPKKYYPYEYAINPEWSPNAE